jgi:hypothetical protein
MNRWQKSTRHKTHRRLWLGTSSLIFIAIGFLEHFNLKGDNQTLFRWMGEGIESACSNPDHEDSLGFALFSAIVLGIWLSVAVLLGWLCQALFVLAANRKPPIKSAST